MRTTRASHFLYLVMGALSVAIVAGVLVASGAFDRTDAGAQSSTATATPTATATRTSTSSAAVPTDVSDIYREVSPGVAYIAVKTAQGGASGSGWVYSSDGTIITNDHVVENANSVSVRFSENGDPIEAKVVGTDPSTDIAVLKIDPSKVEGALKPLQLADSSKVVPGEPAIAIGSPFGLQGTVTSGIISALGREIQAPNGFTISGVIQTDAAINPGNSGGPLLDDQGHVIGINSQIATNGSDSNSGVGFAVPIDTVKQVVPKLLADGKIARAWLGVATADAAPRDGAVVQQVQGAPAQKAGLRPGDTILSFDGRTIKSASDLGQAVLTRKPGDTVKVEVQRNGSRETLNVTLGTRPNEAQQG
ncbi:MAG TPA: trypsin-like peptidase domain-containing protein [Solirubrobacteraceae bacterium]|nr:trypsin-like peptidase domain-containing protein [Solirubrobacteraceae bacterium]